MTFVPFRNKSVADDPEMLAHYLRSLGAEVIPGPKFKFEIPLSETRKIIPEVSKLGLRCEKIAERQSHDLQGRACSIATIQLFRQPAQTEYDAERNLMAAIIR
jgi:hypothetical protein